MNFQHGVKVHIHRLAGFPGWLDHPGMKCDAARWSEELRKALRRFMAERDLKPTPWGVESGLSRGALSNFLNGKSRTLHRESLEKLARNQKVSVSELTGDLPLDGNVTGGIVNSLLSEDIMTQQLTVQLLRQIAAQQEETNRLLAQLVAKSSPKAEKPEKLKKVS